MKIDLIHKNLSTSWLGNKIHFLPSIDSTNNWAKELLDTGAKRGEVFITDYQTKGRGRLDHYWESPPGKNILMSFIDAPTENISNTFQLTILTGVSLLKGLMEIEPNLTWSLKKPNDILLDGKKLGGILSEYQGKYQKVIIGVGLNINMTSSDFTSDLTSTATSLKIQTQKNYSREQIVATLLNCYEKQRSIYDKSCS